jgi:hypothetical protein
MAVTKKGPEAVEVSIAATLALYLNAQIDAIQAVWADNVLMPYPKKIYAGYRMVIANAAYPALVVSSLDGTQTAYGGGGSGFGEIAHRLDVSVVMMSDNQHTLDIQTKRYVEAIWQVLMAHQQLDGTLPGLVGVRPQRYGRSGAYPQKGRGSNLVLQAAGWEVVVTMEDLV